jgi:hypothetical protein
MFCWLYVQNNLTFFCPTKPHKPGTLVCMNVKLVVLFLSAWFCTEYHREHKQEDPVSDRMVKSFALRNFIPWYPHSTHIFTSGLQGVPQAKKQRCVFKNVAIKIPWSEYCVAALLHRFFLTRRPKCRLYLPEWNKHIFAIFNTKLSYYNPA